MPDMVCELSNIEKKYGSHVILSGFSLSVGQGEMVAITGKSGSGKTTILNLIGLIEKSDGGSIKLFDKAAPPVGSHRANLLRRDRIAYLFQNFALIDDESVGNNLEVPLTYSGKSPRQKLAMKRDALKKVGLNVDIKQKIYTLSGGEQQRLSIARILLRPADLILADEPTGSLDEENRGAVLGILHTMNKNGKTIIIVTHDPFVCSSCGRTVRLSDFEQFNSHLIGP